MSPSRMNKSHYVFPRLLALAIAGTVTVAFAEGNVFWWKGPDWGSFNDPTNWDVGEAGAGNPSNLIPGAEDAVAHESDAKIDLGGNTYTIKRRAKDFTSSALASDYAIPYVLHLTNGTLVVTEHHTAKLNIEIWNGATYRFAGSTFTDAYSIWAEAEQKIHAGGRLEVGNSVNTLQLFGIKMTIDEGGVFYMDSKRLECIPTTLKVLTFTNNGTIEAPNGIYGSAPTWGSGADVSDKFPRFTQNAGGVIKLGGNVGRANNTYSKQLGFAVSGGKIEITNSVTFVNMSANPPTITDNASVEIEVKPDSLFDMSAMVFGEGANVMKSGTGDLKMGSVYPSVLAVNAGRLIAAEAASLVGISFAAGTQFRADVQHVRLDECSSFANATFSVAEDLFQIGSTVLISESPAILSHAKEGLDAQLQAAGVQAEGRIESGALVVRSAYPYTFYADRSTDLTDPTAWRSGSVPSAETPVRICGAGAANFTAESVKFASITVEEGATLSVSGGTSESPVDLPPIELDYAARLLLTEGSVVQMTNTFTCIGDASTLPVFEIATNATAIVQTPNFRFVYSAISAWSSFQGYDYGFSLKNVALRWYGTLQTYHGDTGARNEYSRLVLGWAEGGETSYIAIDCRGGRYVAAGEANHAGRCRTPLVIAAPVAPNSGTVVPVGTLYFRDYACVQRSSSAANPEYYVPGFFVGKWSQYNGTGNPVSGNPPM